MRLALVLLFVIAVLGILLATQPANLENEVRIALPFLGADWTGPVLWMVGGWFAAGLLLGYVIALPGRIGAARRARRVEKRLTETGAADPVVVEKPVTRRDPSPTEADEMQRLADEVARRTESVQREPPPSTP